MSQKISALIITYNEEGNIDEVLQSMDFADEIILLDSFSTDRTLERARLHPKVKIFQNKFEDFTKQRNLALTYASNDWILFLDADERLSEACRSEILKTINDPDAKDAYYMYRLFFFCGERINFSGTQNDKNFRLFRKSKAAYDSKKKVHETLIVNGTIGSLKNKIWHYSFADYASYKEKMIHYGELKGKELYAKHKRYSVLSHWAKVSFKFFKAYFLKLGILDGRRGYQLCYLQSLSVHETFKSLKREGKK
ncbi:glycosyltransferase family 2 protein [Sphingobacterium thalpophilum]|uniref:glycosyltransferase family 2 protein n=1 Tax=Sphingobacterium thalpophilum TaxID=259 RepID=UPI002D7A1029|nr:glycosyltransferase family 2 protein [Sphingobacterium thalpophilum]